MPDMMRLFGFPPEARQDAVRFHFGKNLAYRDRINLIFLLVMIGFVLQIWLLMALPGIPFMVIAAALGLVKGYDSRIRGKAFVPDMEWSETSLDRLREIEQIKKRNVKWDRHPLDITNTLGCFVFVAFIAVATFFAFIIAGLSSDVAVFSILMSDFVILVIPFWFTGMRLILNQGMLETKAKVVLELAAYFDEIKAEGEEFKASMRLSRDKGTEAIPVDVRFSVGINPPKSGLYGLQAQVNINVVQGAQYPYFYCVIVGKKGYGVQAYTDKIELPKKVILEYSEDGDAEVLVIRQETTKKSGYHTDIKVSKKILKASVEALRVVAAG